jgi:hypothetical protein
MISSTYATNETYATSETMATLTIRGIEEKLFRQWKASASLAGKSLKNYVIERLNEPTADHREANVPRVESPSVEQRRSRGPKSVPAPVEPCKHGAYPGLCKHQECNR